MKVVLSFDVEEHNRIEAAAGLVFKPDLLAHYRVQLESVTSWLLDQLNSAEVKATFFVVGQVAHHSPRLVRKIHQAGHEIASHGWDHRRIQTMTPIMFREDVRKSMDAIEQVTGVAVLGYRAPTFSIVPQTAWALDVLVESGMAYDSSIYPVRHDRYGVPRAPRLPFMARGERQTILELPPATLRVLGVNAPMGGGGYFRLFPLSLTECAIRQLGRNAYPSIATLYFHPWEFDTEQVRLPLSRLSTFRTYVGLNRTRGRLAKLLVRHEFTRAVDVAQQLAPNYSMLPCFGLGA